MKRFLVILSAFALCIALTACGTTGQQQGSAEQSQAGAQQPSTSQQQKKPEVDYSRGTHHAIMSIKGYKTPIEIEIYSDSAPVTASKFCELVNDKYYDGKTLYWILDGLYVRLGNKTQDNRYLITGEYEESDVHNSNSLKKGVVALSRAEDGQQSDASSFIIFLSDVSYLDGKYAGFAKVTKGLDVITDIAALTNSSDKEDRIVTTKSGKIKKKGDCPVIKSIRMED